MNGSLELLLFPIWGNLDGKIASTDHCMILTRTNNGVKQVELMKSVSFSLIMIVIFLLQMNCTLYGNMVIIVYEKLKRVS